ncbi:MAG: hypothetical protein AAB437_02625 [Patescibacteria group bacterium]
MSKKIIIFLFGLILFLAPLLVSAQKPEDWEPPEKNGTYDVPGKKNLKVRVFVHNPKPELLPVLNCTDDNSSTAQVGAAGWKLTSNWSWYLNISSAPSSISGNMLTIANNSIKTWQDKLTGKVTFSPLGTTTINRAKLDNQNIITWGRTSGTALGVTYIWYFPGLAVETDTIMNKKFPWNWSLQCGQYPNSYDAQNILTHELGHWVGLNDEYDSAVYADHTMYGYGSKGEIKKDTLTTGDIYGVASIY